MQPVSVSILPLSPSVYSSVSPFGSWLLKYLSAFAFPAFAFPTICRTKLLYAAPMLCPSNFSKLLFFLPIMLLCQDFVQIKMRQFSAFNLPEAQPACAFFRTLVRTHPATYNCNDCEFVWCYRRLLDIRRSNDRPVYNREF